jgi:hypothetical protein
MVVEAKDVRVLVPRGRECPVCLGPHDDEIHQATDSIREWFRSEVTRYLE